MRETLTVPSDAARAHLLERVGSGSPAPKFRSETQRDQDRLLYSSAFQRLGGITQVTASELGRPFHTRLTHTLKVAQVARRSAERLREKLDDDDLTGASKALVECLDVAATESAALAHDLGHPPFGHLSEVVLNERAGDAGGFEGNAQSFRIVTRLALRDMKGGLALTRQTLNGVLKYPWLASPEDEKKGKKWGAYSSDEEAFGEVRRYSSENERSLEACLMDWADDVTYAVHDLDDFARAGLIPLDRLAESPTARKRFAQRLEDEGMLEGGPTAAELATALGAALAHIDLDGPHEERPMQRVALRSFGSMLITRYVEALNIVDSPDQDKAVVVIDPDSAMQVEALKQLTMLYVVRDPSLAVLQRGQENIVRGLWDYYMDAASSTGDVRILPAAYRSRLKDEGSDLQRVRLVTDLVASMTEPSAEAVFRRMSGSSSGSVLDLAARFS